MSLIILHQKKKPCLFKIDNIIHAISADMGSGSLIYSDIDGCDIQVDESVKDIFDMICKVEPIIPLTQVL